VTVAAIPLACGQDEQDPLAAEMMGHVTILSAQPILTILTKTASTGV
jgi:hypothetical protein